MLLEWRPARPAPYGLLLQFHRIAPPNRKDFNTNLDTGGDAALLYFELKNAVSFDAQEDSQLVGPNARIRPALATRIALWRGITPPPDLVPLAAESTEATRELSQRREDTLLRTIGALLALCTGKLHKEAIFTAQDDLAEYLDSKTGLRGLGKRNLQKIFAEANTEYDVSANK